MPRPRESRGPGKLTPREAAERMGKSQETVVRYLRSGKLRGMTDIISQYGEVRHEVDEASVEEWLAEQNELATRGHVETSSQELFERFLRVLEEGRELWEPMPPMVREIAQSLDIGFEELVREIREQRGELTARLVDLRGGQANIVAQVERFLAQMQEQEVQRRRQDDREKDYQQENIELARGMLEEQRRNRRLIEEQQKQLERGYRKVDPKVWKAFGVVVFLITCLLVMLTLIFIEVYTDFDLHGFFTVASSA